MAKKIPPEMSNLKSKISNPQSLRVLIVEDSEDDMLLIIRELKKGGYDPVYERVETEKAMSKALREKQWDIILCDYKMPNFSGTKAIALLKETNIDIPLLIISGKIGEETAVECMRLGANDYIMKNNLSRLCPAIARELEEAETRSKHKQATEALRESEEKYRSIIENMQEGYFENDLAGNFTFVNDTLCRDLGYPREELIGMNNRQYQDETTAQKTYQLFTRLYRTDEPVKASDIEIIRKTGAKGFNEVSVSLIRDAEGKPIGFRGISRDVTARKEAEEKIQSLNAELEQMALTDYLTNLYNRRYFMQRGVEEFKRANRNSQPLALLMLDIDEFKKVNDTYSHEAGDLALQQVAAALKSSLRDIDILGRLGGEEFAVLLPNTSLEGAVLLAERMRQTIANTSFKTPGNVLISTITISIGVAAFTDEMSGTDDLLRNADAAMYRAKNSGRNCVGVYKENSDGPRVLPSALDVK